MVDLFEINHYLEFYRKSYEFLKLKFIYNPMGFYANFYVFDVVTEAKGRWTFGVNDTEDALRKIDLCLLDFLAKRKV